jgi:hypothetical protein
MTLLAFLHPGLVGFAALAAVPLVIHLLNRRRYRTVPWAAMDFLLAAYKKKRKRLELENLLLLLLRCAIPVILALVFARPYFGADSLLANLAEPRREVVLVVDDSYSMSRRVGSQTQYQAALEQCRRLVASLDFERGDRVSLVTLAREPQLLVVSGGAADFEHRIAAMQRPTFEPADLGRTLDLILDDLLKQIPAAPEVWLLSDFQRRTFDDSARASAPAAAAPSAAAPAADAVTTTLGKLQRLSQQARLHLVNLSDGTLPPENLAVTDLRASDPLALAGQSVRFTATVTRSGRTPGGTGRFRIGGKEFPTSFKFDAEGKAPAEIYYTCTQPGDVGVEFRLDEDELADDDARFFRIPVKQGLPILVVDGKPGGSDDRLGGDAWNVVLVLDPKFGETEDEDYRRWFVPTVVPWYALTQARPEFSKYEAVIFVNVPEIDAQKVLPDLQTFVESGGGALFFLGDKVLPEKYNEHLFRGDGSGLLAMRLADKPAGTPWSPQTTTLDRADSYFRLEIADELHPAVRTFNDDRRRGFLRSPVFAYWPFAPEADGALPRDTRVVLRFENGGAPALIDHRVGRGRTLWSAVSGAADDWSLFSRTPSAFFPLVWDMLNFLAVRDPGEHDLTVGAAIAKSVLLPPATAAMTTPDGRARPLGDMPRAATRGEYRLPVFPDTKVPGLYALDVTFGGDDVPLHELYAVNVDARESELKFLDHEQVTSVFDHVAIASYGHEISIESGAKEPERQGEIWKRLAMALLVLVLLETVLAWRFGRYTS